MPATFTCSPYRVWHLNLAGLKSSWVSRHPPPPPSQVRDTWNTRRVWGPEALDLIPRADQNKEANENLDVGDKVATTTLAPSWKSMTQSFTTDMGEIGSARNPQVALGVKAAGTLNIRMSAPGVKSVQFHAQRAAEPRRLVEFPEDENRAATSKFVGGPLWPYAWLQRHGCVTSMVKGVQ